MPQNKLNEASRDPVISTCRGKKIIFVFGNLELGGAERQGLHLARYLRESCGAHVQIWGLSNTAGRLSVLCEESRIPWRGISFQGHKFKALQNLIKFAITLRREKPDILMPYTSFPNIACGLVWRYTGAKLCIWNQRDEGLGLSRSRVLHRLAISMTKCFVSNSIHAKEMFVRDFGVRPDQITVIRNGIALPVSRADRYACRTRFDISDDCFTACMIANLHVYKDHVTLLKAWRKVVDILAHSKKTSKLLLAGRFDNTYPILKALVSHLDLTRHVAFLGSVNDVSELLSAADICVHSSHHEGCPNGVLESMAAGLPIAATDIPGIREVVGPDACKYLSKPYDAEGLADIIIAFAQNKVLRISVGAANRLRVHTEFKLEAMCDQELSVISKGLGKA